MRNEQPAYGSIKTARDVFGEMLPGWRPPVERQFSPERELSPDEGDAVANPNALKQLDIAEPQRVKQQPNNMAVKRHQFHHNSADPESHDGRFDEFLRLSPEKEDRLIKWLMPQCDAITVRKRQRKERDRQAFSLLVTVIVANALDARGNEGQQVHYSRKLDTYVGVSVYHPDFIHSKMLRNAVELLEALQLLTTSKGYKNLKTKKGRQSTFSPTQKFLNELDKLAIGKGDLIRSPNAPVLFLRDANKKLVKYDPAREDLTSMISNLRSYNAFMSRHEIGLSISTEDWKVLGRSAWKDGPLRLDRTRLYRVFNNDDWQQGGRFYGGWWQGIRSTFRPYIVINGQKTVELDYSALTPRAMYHELEMDYAGDPYDVPEIHAAADAEGMEWKTVRKSIKDMMVKLIYCNPKQRIERTRGLTLPRGFTTRDVVTLLEEMHAPIRDKFRISYGLRMMRKDSDVCERILANGVRYSVPMLPVHDSFIVEQRHGDILRCWMESSYGYEFHNEPIIH